MTDRDQANGVKTTPRAWWRFYPAAADNYYTESVAQWVGNDVDMIVRERPDARESEPLKGAKELFNSPSAPIT
jgi:hypothetical protein